MCKVSDQLKLCSCGPGDKESLKNFWELTRMVTDSTIMGEISFPAVIDLANEKFNKKTLLRILNSGECFDVPMNFQESDILVLQFACKSQVNYGMDGNYYGDFLAYSYVYKNGKWKHIPYDFFRFEHTPLLSGEIINPLTGKILPFL